MPPPAKVPLPVGDLDSPKHARESATKRHLDRLSRFCRATVMTITHTHTHTRTGHATPTVEKNPRVCYARKTPQNIEANSTPIAPRCTRIVNPVLCATNFHAFN